MTTANTADQTAQAKSSSVEPPKPEAQAEKILCPHCKRTASNGIKCLGICVADSDY